MRIPSTIPRCTVSISQPRCHVKLLLQEPHSAAHLPSDALRAEHVWLLVASEAVREVTCCLRADAAQRMRSRLVELVEVQLQTCAHSYDQAQRNAEATMLEDGTQVIMHPDTGETTRVSLWQDTASDAVRCLRHLIESQHTLCACSRGPVCSTCLSRRGRQRSTGNEAEYAMPT